jgi:hypothetical protein
MKKQLTFLFAFCIVITAVFAEANGEEAKDGVHFVPLLKYDFLSLDSQNIHSPGIGLVVMSDEVLFVGLYTHHSFGEPLLFDYPGVYHSIDVLLDGRKNRHQYLGIFKSESDQPVYGGLRTYQTAIAYGYELVHRRNYSFVLGGGLAVSDFGIERSNGEPWPLIPVPLIRMKYRSRWFETKFEFLTTPNIDLTIGPKSRFRFIGACRMDQFRDIRDLIFECALAYRFFPVDHPMGDFAGISVGVKNDNYGAFDLGDHEAVYLEEDESIEIHYCAVFGMIDLSLLKITGGYAFSGRELYREEDTRELGEGYYLSIEGMVQF